MSYIVKNCPATGAGCCGNTCPKITDCLLKQTVELCKDKIRIYGYYDTDYALGKVKCAESILHLFDIQEVE